MIERKLLREYWKVIVIEDGTCIFKSDSRRSAYDLGWRHPSYKVCHVRVYAKPHAYARERAKHVAHIARVEADCRRINEDLKAERVLKENWMRSCHQAAKDCHEMKQEIEALEGALDRERQSRKNAVDLLAIRTRESIEAREEIRDRCANECDIVAFNFEGPEQAVAHVCADRIRLLPLTPCAEKEQAA